MPLSGGEEKASVEVAEEVEVAAAAAVAPVDMTGATVGVAEESEALVAGASAAIA